MKSVRKRLSKIPASSGLLTILFFISLLMGSMQLKGQALIARPVAYNMGELPGTSIKSNVPLNEINVRAFRQFRKMFPQVSDENWFKHTDGYIVSFVQNAVRNQAHYNRKGAFLYTVRYYEEKDMPASMAQTLKKRYPAFRINVVTEIMNGEKTLYLVKIENHSSVRTISIVDGKMEIIEDLVNGGNG